VNCDAVVRAIDQQSETPLGSCEGLGGVRFVAVVSDQQSDCALSLEDQRQNVDAPGALPRAAQREPRERELPSLAVLRRGDRLRELSLLVSPGSSADESFSSFGRRVPVREPGIHGDDRPATDHRDANGSAAFVSNSAAWRAQSIGCVRRSLHSGCRLPNFAGLAIGAVVHALLRISRRTASNPPTMGTAIHVRRTAERKTSPVEAA
jgi:hypothetical protein